MAGQKNEVKTIVCAALISVCLGDPAGRLQRPITLALMQESHLNLHLSVINLPGTNSYLMLTFAKPSFCHIISVI